MHWSFFLIEKTQREKVGVSMCFCKCFSFVETLFEVLLCYLELQSVMRPCYFVYQSEACVAVSPRGCGDVHPGFGMNYIQDLGVEEA